MKQEMLDCWIGVICLLGGGGWAYMAITTIPGDYEPFVAGPQMFPVLLGVILVLLGLSLVGSSFFNRNWEGQDSGSNIDSPSLREVRVVVSTFILLIGYGFLLDKMGFLVATPIAIITTFICILQIRSWKLIVSMTAGLTIGSYVLFGVIIGTYLPRGTWLQ